MKSDRPRSIVHLDADAFFASVEQAADPRLRGKAVAVGGTKRGIIASASYEARKLGVYTPMPTSRALKLCPKLIVLPGDFEKYERFSKWMFSYAYDFTPDVEVGSIDEGYLDLTATSKSALEIAATIRDAISQSLKITVSEGIGTNKLISQIASKIKKPAAFNAVRPGEEKKFIYPLANYWLPGIGPKTAQRLNSAGLSNIWQIAGTATDLLSLLVGSFAPQLKSFANAIDDRPVVPVSEPAKSYSHQETFNTDQTDEAYIEATLRSMADSLMAKAREDSKTVRTLTVKVRYNDMQEDQCSESLLEPTDLETDVYSTIHKLLRKAWKRRVSLRLVSLKLSNLYDRRFVGMLGLERSDQQSEARHRLAATVDELRRTHGKQAILRGHDFILAKSPPPAEEPCGALKEDVGRYKLSVQEQQRLGPFGYRTKHAAIEALRKTQRATRKNSALFVPLNTHSYYSFLNSTISPAAIAAFAKKNGLPAIALTDTGNLHGAVEFAEAARHAGIKPIFGAEVTFAGERATLYVQNSTGYANLCQLLTTRETNPSKICFDGLIAVAASTSLAKYFRERFYRAVTNLVDYKLTPNYPALFAAPVHYEAAADRWKYDIVQSVRTLTLLRQEHPQKSLDAAFHFPTENEIASALKLRPEASILLDRTFELADRCEFQIPFGPPQFPHYKPSDGSTAHEFLRKLVMEGLRRRYPSNFRDRLPQIEQELTIIADVGYEEYFLVVWDLLQDCQREGISWITRGSAADSLVCYCLGISNICPIRFDLYFRRFLNKDRMQLNKLPDIDIDFPHDRKDDVVDLIFKKYGHEHTAVVGGFSTYQARSAFADVCKVLGVSEFQVRRITERLPHYTDANFIAEAVSHTAECVDLPLNEEPYSTALKMAQFLDGFPRFPKMHPCGVVISRQQLHELTPRFISNKGYPTTHFDMDAVEQIGLIKMDILAQGGLAVMRDVDAMLAANPPAQKPPPPLAPWDDPAIWEMIANGGSRAVHHIESPAMISLCRMCNVRDIDTLVAIVSVIRPGAANESKKTAFARRYQRLEPGDYIHPSLEPCLKSTFGLVVYEEHILQICDHFAGLPGGRADVLRRALGKDKQDVIDEIKKEFFASALQKGRALEDTQKVWELVIGFKGYAFCKAHSAAYGVEAYESAWLKKYFPAEFMAAVLSNGKGFYQPLVYVLESHRLGIPMLPPSINSPGPAFQVVQQPQCKSIRVPISYIKGVSQQTLARTFQERPLGVFKSIADYHQRVGASSEDMELLIRAGAFDEFGQPRTRQFWEAQFLLNTGIPKQGQGWLFKQSPEAANKLNIPLTEPTPQQRLVWEAELFGYCVSEHPLALHGNVDWQSYCPVSRLGEFIGQEVVLCGLIIEDRIFHQVTGEPMKFLTLADWTGIIETELFAKTYKTYGLATVRYPVLEITAIVEPFENNRGHTLRVLRAGKPRLLEN